MDAEKSSSKLSTTITNISIAVGGIGIILTGFYEIQDTFTERNLATAREIMTEVIQAEGLLTAADFNAFVKNQENQRNTVHAFTLDYMAGVDSSLVIILPQLAATDRAILKRLGTIEAKVDANKLPNTEDKLDRVWQFLEAQQKQDSTAQRQKEIMDLLRKINIQKLKTQQGDRVQ